MGMEEEEEEVRGKEEEGVEGMGEGPWDVEEAVWVKVGVVCAVVAWGEV